MNRLEAKALTGGFGDLIQELCVSVPVGQRLVFIGPNGSGKSTLLKLLAGQLRGKGQVLLDGEAILRLKRSALAKTLGYLTQAPEALEHFAVRELVLQGRYPHLGPLGSPSVSDFEAVERAIEDVGLQSLMDRKLSTLSGGERQRAWIALALAQGAQTLLLDEPTTYLDLGHAHEILKLLSRLVSERSMTLVAVLHDLGQASKFADRIVALKDGKIVADGPAYQILTPELIHSLYGVWVRIWTDPETRMVCPIPLD
ncbi:MAG: ABC transporter ATP-binding protein [Deinococcaceae bacterium]